MIDYDKMSVSDLLDVYVRIGRNAGSNGLHQVPSSEELAKLELALRKAVIREAENEIAAAKKEEREKILAWIDEGDHEHTCVMHGIKCISYLDMTRHLKEEA